MAVEPDVAVDAVLVGGGGQVLADVFAVGDAFLPRPRLERKAQRENAAVGTHPGVAEQVPRPADARAPLQDGVGQARVALGDPIGRVDAGDAGADDDDVEVPVLGGVGWAASWGVTVIVNLAYVRLGIVAA